VQLPSSNADYLNNPHPPYPALSLRLNEQGRVIVRVLISKNGSALRGEINQSSGYERLDQAALNAVLGWRFVPGKVDGQLRDLWFDVPVNFKLPN
jgi:protein TonB